MHHSDMHAMLTKQQMLTMPVKNVELKTELEDEFRALIDNGNMKS